MPVEDAVEDSEVKKEVHLKAKEAPSAEEEAEEEEEAVEEEDPERPKELKEESGSQSPNWEDL
jgi:hypothetical protein